METKKIELTCIGCPMGCPLIEIVLITTSDLDISLLIRQQDEDAALEALHKAFEV